MKKRIITAILATVMLLDVTNAAAFATEVADKDNTANISVKADTSQKLNSELKEKLDTMSDDEQTTVWVYFKTVSMEQIRKDAAAECGIEESTPLYLMLVNPSDMTQEDCEIVNEFSYSLTDMEEEQQKEIYDKQKEYRSVYRHMVGNIGRNTNEKYLKECGITDEQIIFKGSLTPYCIVELSKAKILDLCDYDFVKSIYIYEEIDLSPTPPTQPLLKGNLTEYLQSSEEYSSCQLTSYSEPYLHRTAEGVIDWVLVYAETDIKSITAPVYAVFGDRVVYKQNPTSPFALGYAVYDVDEDSFYDISKVWDSDKYEGLQEVLSAINAGLQIGDNNRNGRLDVSDATLLQRFLSEGTELIADKIDGTATLLCGERLNFLSDFNRDGRRSIEDVTELQRFLVEG